MHSGSLIPPSSTSVSELLFGIGRIGVGLAFGRRAFAFAGSAKMH